MTTRTIRVTVNGVAHERTIEPRRLLSDFLREEQPRADAKCRKGLVARSKAAEVDLVHAAERARTQQSIVAIGSSSRNDAALGPLCGYRNAADLESRISF